MKAKILKLKQPRDRLPQLNIEVSEDEKRTIKAAAALAGESLHAWAGKILSRMAKTQIEKGKLPFELLLTPSSNNALTVETKPSNIIPLDGVVAQLVEHHNGIVPAKPRHDLHDNGVTCVPAKVPSNIFPIASLYPVAK